MWKCTSGPLLQEVVDCLNYAASTVRTTQHVCGHANEQGWEEVCAIKQVGKYINWVGGGYSIPALTHGFGVQLMGQVQGILGGQPAQQEPQGVRSADSAIFLTSERKPNPSQSSTYLA
jgi:hypothetical protein